MASANVPQVLSRKASLAGLKPEHQHHRAAVEIALLCDKRCWNLFLPIGDVSYMSHFEFLNPWHKQVVKIVIIFLFFSFLKNGILWPLKLFPFYNVPSYTATLFVRKWKKSGKF